MNHEKNLVVVFLQSEELPANAPNLNDTLLYITTFCMTSHLLAEDSRTLRSVSVYMCVRVGGLYRYSEESNRGSSILL